MTKVHSKQASVELLTLTTHTPGNVSSAFYPRNSVVEGDVIEKTVVNLFCFASKCHCSQFIISDFQGLLFEGTSRVILLMASTAVRRCTIVGSCALLGSFVCTAAF